MFDNGRSHTIFFNITPNNELEFHHTDWGYVNQEDIDTLKYEKKVFKMNVNGKIIKR